MLAQLVHNVILLWLDQVGTQQMLDVRDLENNIITMVIGLTTIAIYMYMYIAT